MHREFLFWLYTRNHNTEKRAIIRPTHGVGRESRELVPAGPTDAFEGKHWV